MGGQNTTSGTTFQENVGAWLACQVLAGPNRATPLIGLASSVTIDDVTAETLSPVDDLKCRTSDGGTLFLQCKTQLSVSGNESSEFGSVWSQFSRQFLTGVRKDDRLVLAVGERAPKTVQNSLRELLDRVRNTQGGVRQDAIAALPIEMNSLLDRLRGLVNDSFARIRGTEANEEEFYSLLSHVYVLRFDFAADGQSVRESTATLSHSVLADARVAENAWMALISLVRDLSPARTGADRSMLRAWLAQQKLVLDPDHSFDNAISVLQSRTKVELTGISGHGEIPFLDDQIVINRPVLGQIMEDAKSGDLLVVGDAGSGKSGVLAKMGTALDSNGCDVVLLTVDHLDSADFARLDKDLQLPTGQTFVDALAGWTGEGAAYLIIDALDAARAASGAKTLQRLISSVRKQASRWRIVASIRAFDLEKSEATQSLFQGSLEHAPTHCKFNEHRVAHVEPLSDSELEQVKAQAPLLKEILAESAPSLTELARSVFNLKLLADLVGYGRTSEQLSGVSTQIELLDEYWKARVIEPENCDQREEILGTTTNAMVAQRLLTISGSTGTGNTSVYAELASDGVLALGRPLFAGGVGSISYSHNLLFDYAVSRLWVRDIPSSVIDQIADPDGHDLLLAIRPSIQISLDRLWSQGIDGFWAAGLRWYTNQGMPPIGRMLVAIVAAERFHRASDVSPLLLGAKKGERPAIELLDWMVRAAIGKTRLDASAFPLVGPDSPNWLNLARQLTSIGSDSHWPIRNFLAAIFYNDDELVAQLTDSQMQDLAFVARFLTSSTVGTRSLVDLTNVGIHVCCVTLSETTTANLEALTTVLDEEIVKVNGYKFLPTISDHLPTITRFAPEFVSQFTRVYLAADASADDEVPMGTGPVLSLISNKKQSLKSVDYRFAKVFPSLLEVDPETATVVAVHIVEDHIQRRSGSDERPTHSFSFWGIECEIREDYSCIWDSGLSHTRHKLWWTVADALFSHLATSTQELTDVVIRTLCTKASSAFFFRRLLESGAKAPDSLGIELVELLGAPAILTGYDTCKQAGDLLGAIFGILTGEQRNQIENVIRSLPDLEDEFKRDLEKRRGILLGCLPEEFIECEQTREILSELRRSESVPQNTPPFESSGMRFVSEEELEREQGIDVESAENAAFRVLRGKIKKFCENGNRTTTLDEVEGFAPTLNEFELAVLAPDSPVDPRLMEYGEDYVANCYEMFARCEHLQEKHWLWEQTRTHLIRASDNASPNESQIDNDAWESELGHWGSPSSRVEAAQGVVFLLANSNQPDESLLRCAKKLAFDRAPQVRFQILRGLSWIWKHDKELSWEISHRTAFEEPRKGLLNELVSGWLLRFGRPERHRVRPLIDQISNRMINVENGGVVLKDTTFFYLRAWLYDRDNEAYAHVERAIGDPIAYSDEATELISRLGQLIADEKGPPNSDPEWFWSQASSELSRIFVNCMDRFDRVRLESEANDVDQTETLRTLAHHVEFVVNSVSRGVGISHEDFRRVATDEELPRVQEYIHRFRDLIETTLTVPFASPAYELLGLLHFMTPVAPRDILLWANILVQNARKGDLHIDSLAADRVVSLVELFLVDYREVFQGDAETQQALISILDTFVEQGWPKAQALVVRLDEVTRG